MLQKDELIAVVDGAFDDARARLGVDTDEALAKKLGISTKTISFFRNGRWTPVDEALITVLVSTLHIPTNRPIA